GVGELDVVATESGALPDLVEGKADDQSTGGGRLGGAGRRGGPKVGGDDQVLARGGRVGEGGGLGGGAEVAGPPVPEGPGGRVGDDPRRGGDGEAKRSLTGRRLAVLDEPHKPVDRPHVEDDLVTADATAQGRGEDRRRVVAGER